MNSFFRIISFLILSFLLPLCASSQKDITRVYLFPGQGSDERIFSNIRLNPEFQMVNITYPVPARGTTMKEYARIISSQIDTSEKCVLVGVSLGGMICTELADMLHPEKVIIISSAKCRSELPKKYTIMNKFPAYKLYSKKFIKWGTLVFQPMVEHKDDKDNELFKGMLKGKDPQYMKQTFSMIINWDRERYSPDIIHIHGADDHVLPANNIKANYVIDDGTHIMTYTRGKEVSEIISSILSQQPSYKASK